MKKMTAKEFLKTLNLPKNWSGEDEEYGQWLFYEKNVIEAMEQYHQSKVNNVVLDDVSKQGELLKAFIDFYNYRNTGDKTINNDEIEIFIDSL